MTTKLGRCFYESEHFYPALKGYPYKLCPDFCSHQTEPGSYYRKWQGRYRASQYQIHYINELEAKLAVYSHLALAMDDIKLGRVQSADDAFADILGELENLDI